MLLARLGGGGPAAASRLPSLVLRRGADALPRFRPPIPARTPLFERVVARSSGQGVSARSIHQHQHRQSNNRYHYNHPPPPPPRPPPSPSPLVPTSRLKARVIVYGVIGANLVVYYWWWLARGEGPQYSPWSVRWARTTEKLDWMRDNFILSADNVLQGRWWTLLTSAFSHYDTVHLAGEVVARAPLSWWLMLLCCSDAHF